MEKIKQLLFNEGHQAINNALMARAMNALFSRQVFNSGALAAGTTNTKFQTAARISGVIDGKLFSVAATDDAMVLPANSLTATQVGGYVLTLTAAGVFGALPATPSATLAALGSVVWPAVPIDQVSFGLILINLANPAVFTAGTTALSATNVTLINHSGALNPTNLF